MFTFCSQPWSWLSPNYVWLCLRFNYLHVQLLFCIIVEKTSAQELHGAEPANITSTDKIQRIDLSRGTYPACAFWDLCQELLYKVETEPFKANCGQNADQSRMEASKLKCWAWASPPTKQVCGRACHAHVCAGRSSYSYLALWIDSAWKAVIIAEIFRVQFVFHLCSEYRVYFII